MPGGHSRQTGQHGSYDKAVPVWKAGIAVAVGDFIYRDVATGYDMPAGSYTWDTDTATTQASFHDVFRGVSEAQRRTTQTTDGGISDGMIAKSGEWVYPCAALGTAVTPGEYVAPAKQSGNLLEPQKVVITTTLGNAIGVVTRDVPVGGTFIYFDIKPALSADRGVSALA